VRFTPVATKFMFDTICSAYVHFLMHGHLLAYQGPCFIYSSLDFGLFYQAKCFKQLCQRQEKVTLTIYPGLALLLVRTCTMACLVPAGRG
jgi:hypothetical protein